MGGNICNRMPWTKTLFYSVPSVINFRMVSPAISDIIPTPFHFWGSVRTNSAMVTAKNNDYVSVSTAFSVLRLGVGGGLAIIMQIYTLIAYYSPTGPRSIYFLGCLASGNSFFLGSFFILDQITTYFLSSCFFWSWVCVLF